MPMILVQGDADQAVPVEQTRLWAEKMKSLKMTYEYHELPGVGHSDAIVNGAPAIFKFFDKHVKPESR
jgi:dipeptidyl aminopeptidase/acylaminoacyl peptidase